MFINTGRDLIAEQIYAVAWKAWLLTTFPETKARLETIMDEQQIKIASGPGDPRWVDFIETLPGYKDFWKRIGDRLNERTQKRGNNV